MPAKGWRADPIDRLTKKIRTGPGGCWVWTGSTTGKSGYGMTNLEGKTMVAHRAVWMVLVGPIEEGAQLDHLCRNRLCVNPAHLEPVTPRTNWERGNTPSSVAYRTGLCKRGHPLEGDNLVAWQLRERGVRACRTCYRAHQRAYKKRKRGVS